MAQDLDTTLLRTFCAVAETASFSLTAQRVHRTQSAVSEQIKKLEAFAGCRLVARTTRRVALTAQGEDFLRMAKNVLYAVDSLSSAFGGDTLDGDISFGAPEDFATSYLPDIVSGFASEHPKVRLHVSCELTLDLIERLHRGERDLVVIKADPEKRLAGSETLWREDLVWIGRSQQDKYFAQVCADCERQGKPFPLISAPPPCVYRGRATQQLDRLGISWSNVYVSPSVAGALAAARAGLGYLVMPKAMVPTDLLALEPSDGWPMLQQAEICLLGQSGLSLQAQAFASFIREKARGLRAA
jgi:DNA-binding transcriptional LysR family regulator